MEVMDVPVERLPVQQPVRPVEPGVVQEIQNHDREDQVQPLVRTRGEMGAFSAWALTRGRCGPPLENRGLVFAEEGDRRPSSGQQYSPPPQTTNHPSLWIHVPRTSFTVPTDPVYSLVCPPA